MTWPAGLQSLTLGYRFNQSLDNVTWPAGLQNLTFGAWPACLQSLALGDRFNQNLGNVMWPAGLQNLFFGTFSAKKLNVVWPEGLQSLSLLNIEHPEEILPALEESAPKAVWPRALRKLVFDDLALVC